ncbi:MBL fold hydrolase [Saccharobesus litoralis]|uniref:MBL fold hydrolase n=1 Tax=Saccharobesus litoralis TaxID=2172099 RepID=A0A2S0VRE5_9ALTE|nr:MBL fold metallo-hydrolase [Saccharobesus litoralis]AWB66764.1 MBL fold hydrolase [Saccharobesus litoralis]
MDILHHGAVDGVTGSCHQLVVSDCQSYLIDCGAFQGAEVSAKGAGHNQLEIEFDISTVQALIVTHCHIDHVGRIPYLIAAGFKGAIICSRASARLLPLVLQDAIELSLTRNKNLVDGFLRRIEKQMIALDYKTWFTLPGNQPVAMRLQRAGHILGSAYVEFDIKQTDSRVVFSGDLGAPYTPLLPAPQAPRRADILVIESTYGDRLHEKRKQRRQQLKRVIERALANKGTVLIPAFSIGRTQELLYELEDIIHKSKHGQHGKANIWQHIDVIVDSPLAAKFTEYYRELSLLWDEEARAKLKSGRHPLSFEQLYTVASHDEHVRAVNYLHSTGKPAIVIAASGMCAGGRIVNYLKQLLPDARTDVLFVGYQAQGTLGRDIQTYAPRGGYVFIDEQKVEIKAQIYTLSGYSAHADQQDLINFVTRINKPPQEIRIVHGDNQAKLALQHKYSELGFNARVMS